ncbi:hypothetical protein [Photobacterium profundum]|uniref:hypothetical protein n=1 Tax=Photobacterium profundum TaxID=74109 RepID=UPI0012F4D101|nr:hypothetical protein [Photobacterium profundum]
MFSFKPVDHSLIDSLPMNDVLRGFAQGLLVEAIDASYKLGYVEAIFRSSANPTKGAISLLKTFTKKASSHWFKHTRVHELQNIQVYQFVLEHLAVRFKSSLPLLVVKSSERKKFGAFLAYSKPSCGCIRVWG